MMYVDAGHACGGVIVSLETGTVVRTAPIFKWMVGRQWHSVKAWQKIQRWKRLPVSRTSA